MMTTADLKIKSSLLGLSFPTLWYYVLMGGCCSSKSPFSFCWLFWGFNFFWFFQRPLKCKMMSAKFLFSFGFSNRDATAPEHSSNSNRWGSWDPGGNTLSFFFLYDLYQRITLDLYYYTTWKSKPQKNQNSDWIWNFWIFLRFSEIQLRFSCYGESVITFASKY